MHHWSRLRLELARRPWIYWLFAGTCACLVGLSIHSRSAEVDEQRRKWGTTRSVLVAAADHLGGDPLRFVRREYPEAMVPDDALDEISGDEVAARVVPRGAVLVAPDVVGDVGPPPGWVVFATASDRAPAVHPGARVAVFGDGHRWCDGLVTAGEGSAGRSPARTSIGASTVEVAVPPSCAEAISGLVLGDRVVLARTG